MMDSSAVGATPKEIVIFESKSGYCSPDDIIVNPHYKQLLPRPTDKEYENMRESIKEHGQQKPVELDQHMVMVDGFTRLDICVDLGKQVWFEQKYYEDKTAVLLQMKILNLDRRNLIDYQKVLLYDEIFQHEKKQTEKVSEINIKLATLAHTKADTKEEEKTLKEKRDKIGTGRAVDKFSKIINVSQGTIRKSRYVDEHGEKKIKDQVVKKEMSLSEAYWKTREKQTRKTHKKEKMKEYFFEIRPAKGSGWKTKRMLRPKQVTLIKSFIMHMKV